MTSEIERIPTVGVVVLNNDKVLLVCHGDGAGHVTGSYGTPGGRIDPGEDTVTAAVRELKEETGIDVQPESLVEFPEKYLADIPRKNGAVLHVSHTTYATRNFSGELQSTEETTPVWIEIDKLKEMELLPNIEDMVQKAQHYLPHD